MRSVRAVALTLAVAAPTLAQGEVVGLSPFRSVTTERSALGFDDDSVTFSDTALGVFNQTALLAPDTD